MYLYLKMFACVNETWWQKMLFLLLLSSNLLHSIYENVGEVIICIIAVFFSVCVILFVEINYFFLILFFFLFPLFSFAVVAAVAVSVPLALISEAAYICNIFLTVWYLLKFCF